MKQQHEQWLEAAQRYRKAEEQKQQEVSQQQVYQQQKERERVQEDRWRLEAANIADVARALDQFLTSQEGQSAMALLGAAKRHIIFGEECEGGIADVAFIDASGLQRSIEAGRVGWAYHKLGGGEVPKPRISAITAWDAVQSAVWNSKKKPREVLPWLRDELDKIADAAPSK